MKLRESAKKSRSTRNKGGVLTLARGEHQVPMLRSTFTAYERLGLGSWVRLLNAEEAVERIRVTNVHGALLSSENASLQPGRMVRGLARAIERRAGVIYERTEVLNFDGRTTPRFVTHAGEVRAHAAIVLAGTVREPRCAVPFGVENF